MPILSKEEAQAILKKVLSYSKADECEVSLNGSEGGNIRYALNAVSTAGDISTMSFAQLRRCLELFVQARLRRTETGWKAELPDGSMPYKPRIREGSSSSFEGTAFALPRRALMEKQNVAFN